MDRRSEFEQYKTRITSIIDSHMWSHDALMRVKENEKLRANRDSGGSCKTCKHARESGLMLRCKAKHKQVKHYNICQLFEGKEMELELKVERDDTMVAAPINHEPLDAGTEDLMRKRPTNEEFVSYLMNDSKYGQLAQVFVVEAIRYYSELIVKQPAPTEDNGEIISNISWYGIATEVQNKMIANYEGANV